jgi:PRC-barrel domain
MNKLIIASAAAALMMGVSASAFAQATQQDCQSMFQKADVNKDSSLQAEEAKVFLDAMNQAQVQPKDASMVTQDEFMQACQKNAFANIDPNTIGTAAATGTTTTGQGTTTTDQSAAGTTTTETTTTDQSTTGTATTTDTATTDQPESGTTATTTTTTDPAATGTATTDQTASTDTTGQAQQQSGEQALAAPSGLLASNIIGSTVYSQDNQSIGDINDIILSQEGQPSQVIVGVGGFLGIGEKDVVLEMSKLQIAATEDGSVKIVAQTSPEELRNMPPFMRQGAGEQQPEQQQQQQQ